MLVWLLVLLLLLSLIYVVYRMTSTPHKEEFKEKEQQHYTFKI
ncbi:hypothetical protein [Sulfurimonas sp. SWIR-19]|nr:hypothetical protein [Sulfurimonas sp. SWIR-19]